MNVSMRCVVLVAATLASIVGLGAGPASAAELVDHGWWWRAQTGFVASLPPPPTVPDDGLAVAAAPDGDLAVAAVRFQLAGGETAAFVTLTTANAQGVPSLMACPPTARWSPADAGRWDARPTPDCGISVPGEPVEDMAAYRFDAEPFVVDGVVDLVIVPTSDADPFQVAFEPPTTAALQVSRPPPAPPAVPDVQAPAPPPDPAPQPTSLPLAEVSGPQPAVPPAPPSVDAPLVAPPPTAVDPTAPSTPTVQAGPAAAAMTDADRSRPLGIVLLAMAFLVVTRLREEVVPPLRGVGRFARTSTDHEQTARGLGRFSRPRTTPPPRLF